LKIADKLTQAQRNVLYTLYNNRNSQLKGNSLVTARKLAEEGLLKPTNDPRMFKFTTTGSNVARNL
jgi:hypothetical protein